VNPTISGGNLSAAESWKAYSTLFTFPPAEDACRSVSIDRSIEIQNLVLLQPIRLSFRQHAVKIFTRQVHFSTFLFHIYIHTAQMTHTQYLFVESSKLLNRLTNVLPAGKM